MATQFSYFATCEDLKQIVQQIELANSFQYIEFKNFSSSEFAHALKYDSLLDYPHLGHAQSGQCRGTMFLVLPSTQDLKLKHIPTDEEDRIIVSQELNQPSVVWALGGHWRENMLLRGEISTIYTDAVSKQMLSLLRKAFAKHCKKVKGYYISPHAHSLDCTRYITISENENIDVDFQFC